MCIPTSDIPPWGPHLICIVGIKQWGVTHLDMALLWAAEEELLSGFDSALLFLLPTSVTLALHCTPLLYLSPELHSRTPFSTFPNPPRGTIIPTT